MKNYVDYANATVLMQAIAEKIEKLGCYHFRGSIPFAQLPATPTATEKGYLWNITNDFTTDARFIEGAGKKYYAGENVGVADLSTYDAVTPVGSEDPSTEGWYELVAGKYVLSEDTTVDPLKTYYEFNELYKLDCLGQFVDIDAILDIICKEVFDATKEYEIGKVVRYTDNKLYKFKVKHEIDDPWDASKVDETTVIELIAEAEPENLTDQQVGDLIAILG